ncbi:MAG: hypothetical protein CUN54_10315, partial [Phototrophicales bacterium]
IDQQQWYRVFTPRDQVTNDWTNESVSLSDVAEFAEIDLNRPVFFKFQHYGNGTLPDAGRGFDDIRIASAQRDTDWYSITLADGESLAARLDTAAVADITLEIHDTNGMIVQSNRIGDSVELQPFVDKTN